MKKLSAERRGKSNAIFHPNFIIGGILKNNHTFNSFAESLDVSTRTIHNVCSGKKVSLTLAQKIIEQLNLPQKSLKYSSSKEFLNIGLDRIFDFSEDLDDRESINTEWHFAHPLCPDSRDETLDLLVLNYPDAHSEWLGSSAMDVLESLKKFSAIFSEPLDDHNKQFQKDRMNLSESILKRGRHQERRELLQELLDHGVFVYHASIFHGQQFGYSVIDEYPHQQIPEKVHCFFFVDEDINGVKFLAKCEANKDHYFRSANGLSLDADAEYFFPVTSAFNDTLGF